jgi:Helicase HerA, central domain
MREQITDQRIFLGNVRPEDHAKVKDSPLVAPWDGRPAAVWNFGPTGPPHLGMWGTTGGGKSSLARLILRGLVRRPGQRAITIIDGEGAGEYTMFRRMPGVAQIVNMNPAADRLLPEGQATSVERAAQALIDHHDLAVERNLERDQAAEAWEEYLVDPAHHQPPRYVPPAEMFLFIDGWSTFCYNLNRYLPRRQRLDPVEAASQYGRNGRKTDAHLVLADQVSYAKRSRDDTGLPSELKKQLGIRIAAVGRLGMTATEASMVFDDTDAGHRVPKTPGGCLLKVGAELVPFVAPKWDNATDPNASLTADERRAAYRLLPPPEAVA